MLRRTTGWLLLGLLLAGGARLAFDSGAERGLDASAFWLQKTFPERLFDGVIVGDSRVYRGVSPELVEAQLGGRSVHNFGYSSARLTPKFLDAAEALLDPDSGAPFVVIGLTAHSLSAPPAKGANPHFDGFASRSRASVYVTRRGEWLAGRALPSLIADPTVRLQMARQKAAEVTYHQHFDGRGFVASTTDPVDPQRALPGYRKTLAAHPVATAQIEALADWVRGAVQRGVTVVVFVPPRPAAMAGIERGAGWSETALRRRLQGAGAQWLSVPFEGLSSYDGSHLDAASAKRFSQALGRRLSRVQMGQLREPHSGAGEGL
jgi:hypothetical protein